ncbi:MAG TPA: Clp protease N-terminal domain-containing protein [Pseudonocardiaceae bacterium]|jgi:ATP-dependent Clp protease ATP-binding subunit ClpC
MFERFTVLAKRAISLAQDEAIALGHDFIGTEHILLGLTGTGDEVAVDVLGGYGVTTVRARDETVRLLTEAGVDTSGGRAATEALAAIGIDVDEIRRHADEAFGPGRFRYPRPPFTSRAKHTLKLTLREAVAMGHTDIGTEHLVLGLLDDPKGVGYQVLTGLGVDPAGLRGTILSRVRPQAS